MAVLEKQPSNTLGFLHFVLRKWLFSTPCQQRRVADGHNQAVRQSESAEADIQHWRDRFHPGLVRIHLPLTMASWDVGKVFMLKSIRVIGVCVSWWRA
jgi:hypothetical protein